MFVDLRVTEYAHVAPSSPFRAGVSATGNGATATTGNLSAGAADLPTVSLSGGTWILQLAAFAAGP